MKFTQILIFILNTAKRTLSIFWKAKFCCLINIPRVDQVLLSGISTMISWKTSLSADRQQLPQKFFSNKRTALLEMIPFHQKVPKIWACYCSTQTRTTIWICTVSAEARNLRTTFRTIKTVYTEITEMENFNTIQRHCLK